jgi:hypothetical protein
MDVRIANLLLTVRVTWRPSRASDSVDKSSSVWAQLLIMGSPGYGTTQNSSVWMRYLQLDGDLDFSRVILLSVTPHHVM